MAYRHQSLRRKKKEGGGTDFDEKFKEADIVVGGSRGVGSLYKLAVDLSRDGDVLTNRETEVISPEQRESVSVEKAISSIFRILER